MQLEKFAMPTEGEKITIDNGILKFLITQSFLLSKATAQAAISGKLPSAFLMQLLRKPIKARKKSLGMKCLPARKHLILMANGCQLIR